MKKHKQNGLIIIIIGLILQSNLLNAQYYSPDKFSKKEIPMVKKEDKVKVLSNQRDNVKNTGTNAIIRYAKTRVPNFSFLPVISKDAAELFFENKDDVTDNSKEGIFSVEHAYLNYLSQSKRLAAYSELLHDYFGPVRVSLGLIAMLPASKDSASTTKVSDSIWNKKSFVDKFKSGGGLTMLNFTFPLIHAHDNKYIDFKLYASPRFCIDAPKEDTNLQRFAHHTQLGLEAQLKIVTHDTAFSFLLCWRGMEAWGNSTFYDNMGFTGDQRKSFNFNTWTVGFIAKKKLAFYYTWYSGDSRAINQVGQKNNNTLTANYQF